MRIQGTVLYILLLHILANKADAIDPDGEALLNFKDSIIGSDGVFLHWTAQSADACSWEGVKCNPQTNRVTDVILSYHKLSGSISQHISKLEHLKLLALDNNNLYGPIPSELSNCTELRSLYLQGNYISGSIPSELGNLSELRYLDVSSNSLGGHLPSSLGSLTKLSVFNVSANFLLGPIPPEGILVKFQRSSFSGNRGLCGKPIDVACRRGGNGSDSSARPRARGNSGRLLISASATIGALLLVALMCFWGCFLYKRLSKGAHGGRGPLGIDLAGGASIVMFHGDLPYSSKDIVRKLETLKEDDVIGVGGFGTVYRLSMDDGSVFALKRIVKFKDSFFDRELEILGSIKHRYLVNLRGYCNSPTSKLLLYDFLPGGSLDEVLHERSGALDWDARMNIAMGAAKGLAYLHHDCSPRIIHRDIKSSNILLDGNLDTRVSDFGLAKLLEDDKSHITTIVAGTFGYLAPEYMQSGRATEKTDVYSFGVLLLELLSRKRPTDASFIEKGLNIVGWMNFLVTENRHREIVDGSCGGAEQQGLDTLLSLAIQCVSASPEDRPTMNQVAQVLESQVMTPCPSDFYDSSSD